MNILGDYTNLFDNNIFDNFSVGLISFYDKYIPEIYSIYYVNNYYDAADISHSIEGMWVTDEHTQRI